ncbi:MAG: hypothetical protein V7670_15130 [Maribacter arcticus]|uniref:hypothetical protein n=1 Tax=Maribacter arcticus TaxID=561365 RepID=UPI003002384A
MEKDKNKSFTKWLEILQQESWQLELLISGFAIFLLAESYEPIRNLDDQISLLLSGSGYYGLLYVPYQVMLGAWYVLIINLILHVLLRGLWISTIGLRYVSGDIDFNTLNISSKFDRFLRSKIVSFDLYIQQLEKLCSSVFGFTFLIIFILISGGLFVLGIFILAITMQVIDTRFGDLWVVVIVPFLVLYLLGGLIYFLDFITLGWLKRKKGIARFYYPIYRFFSVITLAFIYRPIYYNLLDNKYGRNIILFLIPYLIGFTLIASLTVNSHVYLPGNRTLQSISNNFYDDTLEDRASYSASISSKFVKNGYAQLFLPYVARTDDKVIEAICPDLKPAKTGFSLFGIDDPLRNSMNADLALDCHTQRFKIYVNDTLLNHLKYRFHEHPTRKNIGLLTVLDVGYLPRGEHIIKVYVKLLQDSNGKDTLLFRESALIPFWKE